MKIDRICIRDYIGHDYISITRPSLYGNIYSSKDKSIALHKVASKKIAIDKYREYILENIDILDALIRELEETKYSKIGCFCKNGSKCHGDILVELIKERTTKSIF